MSFALTGDGKTVLKANYGTYWWNPGRGAQPERQPEPGSLVPPLRVERPERRPAVSAGRGRTAEQLRRRRRERAAGRGPERHLHDRKSRSGSSASCCRTSACAPASSGAVSGSSAHELQRQPAVRRLHRAGDRCPIRVPTACAATPTTARRSPHSTSRPSTSACRSSTSTTTSPGDADYYTWEVTGTKRMSEPLVDAGVVLAHLERSAEQQLLRHELPAEPAGRSPRTT